MKKFFFSAGLLMAMATVSFAGNPIEVKTTTDPSTSVTKTTDDPMLYWYPVTYDLAHPSGYIPQGTEPYDYATQSTVTSPCPSGSTKDCIRGFVDELTEQNEDTSAPSIKKP